VRGAEGRSAVGPGRSSNRAWSEGPKNYIRNVEAVGSNPITSTKSPGQRAKVGSPQRSDFPACLYVSLSTKSGSPEIDEVGRSRGRVRDDLGRRGCADRRQLS
jgi:hypothetical protein